MSWDSTVSDPDSKCKRDHWSCVGAVFNHEHSLDKEDSVGLPTLVNSGCLKAFAVNQIQLIKAMFTYVQSPVLSSCTTISA